MTEKKLYELARFGKQRRTTTQGVYILCVDGEMKYVGKANDLPKRLKSHRFKLSGRHGIELKKVAFKAFFMDKNWRPLTHEGTLIKHYGCEWNTSGFGNHDPGRRRDKTKYKKMGFDLTFPINPDFLLTNVSPGNYKLHKLLFEIKKSLPYLLRFEKKNKCRPAHPDFAGKYVTIPEKDHPLSVKEMMCLIADELGDEWQFTILPGYMILYKENDPQGYSHSSFVYATEA